jgi:malate dehydrogenase (oxaloacetate-decarboxylating)(NADP+)
LHPFPGTAEALAAQVTQENFDKGLIYPPFKNIRKISAEIAAKVAAKAYELGESFFLLRFIVLQSAHMDLLDQKAYIRTSILPYVGLATRVPPPRDLVKHAESCMYSPAYRSYR